MKSIRVWNPPNQPAVSREATYRIPTTARRRKNVDSGLNSRNRLSVQAEMLVQVTSVSLDHVFLSVDLSQGGRSPTQTAA